MKSCFKAALAVTALLVSGISQASEGEGVGLGVGAKVGTTGLGVELTKSFTDTINGRLGLNSYSYSRGETVSDIDYDADLDLQSAAAFLDWYPGGGDFRVSLGFFANSNEINMTGQPTAGEYVINGVTYTELEVGSLKGNVGFANGAYFGIGWGNAVKGKGLGFSVDLGVLSQGSPDVVLSATGGTLSNDPTLQDHLQAEAQSAEDDLDEFKYYPVIAVGVTYAF